MLTTALLVLVGLLVVGLPVAAALGILGLVLSGAYLLHAAQPRHG